MAAYPTIARVPTEHRIPARLLHALPVPHHPWSHLSLDFITCLPLSRGNTVVVIVVDRFSRMVYFIALPKLPTASETARLIIDYVFKYH